MDSVLLPLMDSPQLPDYVEELSRVLAAEAVARQQFYDWLDENKKAEFINGEIIVHSPARLEHTDAQKLLVKLLDTYATRHDLGLVLYEKALVKLKRNDYEPDICFWREQVAATFERDQMFFPAPDLVVEVLSPSTESRDRGAKFTDYAASGVSEYWLVNAAEQSIEQYERIGKAFRPLATLRGSDRLRSQVLAGFDVPLAAGFDPVISLTELKRLLA